MIQCDDCKRWYHLECLERIGKSPEKEKQFICKLFVGCKNNGKEEKDKEKDHQKKERSERKKQKKMKAKRKEKEDIRKRKSESKQERGKVLNTKELGIENKKLTKEKIRRKKRLKFFKRVLSFCMFILILVFIALSPIFNISKINSNGAVILLGCINSKRKRVVHS